VCYPLTELGVNRHQPHNRFLECALAANAEFIVTVKGPLRRCAQVSTNPDSSLQSIEPQATHTVCIHRESGDTAARIAQEILRGRPETPETCRHRVAPA
jgi:hypothetical protein